MTFEYGDRETGGKKEEGIKRTESPLHAAFNYSKERLKIALEAHTVLSTETKKIVSDAIDRVPVDGFMSHILDQSTVHQDDKENGEEKATQWLVNAVADDVMPRFPQNKDRYVDVKQANTLLTFFRGALHKQST